MVDDKKSHVKTFKTYHDIYLPRYSTAKIPERHYTLFLQTALLWL